VILVVAATDGELRGADRAGTLVCGVGPVEAAARTASALAHGLPAAVLHVGVAGARGFDLGGFAIGSSAVYSDADDAAWIDLEIAPDERLVAAARRALPDARVVPIATTARVGGATACEIEAMEGYAVLRACALAHVPAVEVRALSNEIAETDRARWRLDEAKRALAGALPQLIAAVEEAVGAHA
jgi:nucleoside phosphorylase